MTTINEILGLEIRNLRKHKGLSQEQLAELSEMHHTYIGQIERGEKNITIGCLAKISKALDVSLSNLLKNLENFDSENNSTIQQIYDLLIYQSPAKQIQILKIIQLILNEE